MFEIVNKQILAENIKRIDVVADSIARKIKPGQFVSVSSEEGEERISLSVVDADPEKGTLSLIFHETTPATRQLGAIPIHESIFSILGPLGVPAEIEKVKTVICIATGIGAASLLPVCRGFKKCGSRVIGIIGAKTKRSLMLESQMRLCCNKVFIATEDGSYEQRGRATDILKKIIDEEKVELVYAIGSVDMMEAVCTMTKERNIKTKVHLNAPMVDGMGMCGSCRVKVGGKTVLACVEGPEFDGHKVDFEIYRLRQKGNQGKGTCHSHPSPSCHGKEEPTILTKFLSAILRK